MIVSKQFVKIIFARLRGSYCRQGLLSSVLCNINKGQWRNLYIQGTRLSQESLDKRDALILNRNPKTSIQED